MADKGIRAGIHAYFVSLLPQLPTLGSRGFRKNVLTWATEQYIGDKLTWSAACTHYNFAKHKVTAATPELVVGLGRPEGKNNGGRKKKVETAPVASVTDAGASITLADVFAQRADDGDAVDGSVVDAAAPLLLTHTEVPAVKLVTLVYTHDGSVVAEGLTVEAANELIEKAAKARKKKMMIKE